MQLEAPVAARKVPAAQSAQAAEPADAKVDSELVGRIVPSVVKLRATEIAESATVVQVTEPGKARSTSLVPSIHIALLPIERIVADLPAVRRGGGHGGIGGRARQVDRPVLVEAAPAVVGQDRQRQPRRPCKQSLPSPNPFRRRPSPFPSLRPHRCR